MLRDQKLWTWHLIAGVVILVLLGLHMLTMHLDAVFRVPSLNPSGGRPIDWANVAARGRSALLTASYVLLLGAALFHGLYGLRNILVELNLGGGLRRAVGVVLLVLGLGLFALGAWAAVRGHDVALAAPQAEVVR